MINANKYKLLNGNQAVAQAAFDAGVHFFSHYPGSPVNTVEPELKKLNKEHKATIFFNDALNEHIATLSCMGASFSGARSMLVMKHVGMNIASDPLNYVGYTGVKGGMVIVVGTDPGANSSTGEQDVHWYAKQFNIPLIEPISVQDIYDKTSIAYKISEQYEVPVLLFIPVAYSYAIESVILKKRQLITRDFYFEKDRARFINVGKKAVKNHKKALEKLNTISLKEDFTQTFFNNKATYGIITRGLAFNYVYEYIHRLGLEEQIHILNFELVFPVNKTSVLQFIKEKEKIVFIEDQDGFLEFLVKQEFFNQIDAKVHGKDIFPSYGALSIDTVKHFLQKEFDLSISQKQEQLPVVLERLGTFCEGCPHRSFYQAIFEGLKGYDGIVGGDIGCSSLPPFKADWLLCMNAGIGVSQGIAALNTNQVMISTGGDGSFFHAGMLSLQSAIENNIDLIHFVFDNGTVAMTGHQYSPSVGGKFDIPKLLESLGADKYYIMDVTEIEKTTYLLRHEIKQKGVRVFWLKGDCALMSNPEREEKKREMHLEIKNELCATCSICYDDFACPAININKLDLLFIDSDLCVRCGACRIVCPNEAIVIVPNIVE